MNVEPLIGARGQRISYPSLARGARDLIAKITEAIPPALRPVLLDAGLKPISYKTVARETFEVADLRGAIRDRRKVAIAYEAADGRASERTIWPIFIAYMEEVRIIVAWCELRTDFRHYRTDRVRSLQVLEERIPEPIPALRKRWAALRKREP